MCVIVWALKRIWNVENEFEFNEWYLNQSQSLKPHHSRIPHPATRLKVSRYTHESTMFYAKDTNTFFKYAHEYLQAREICVRANVRRKWYYEWKYMLVWSGEHGEYKMVLYIYIDIDFSFLLFAGRSSKFNDVRDIWHAIHYKYMDRKLLLMCI